MSVNATDQAGFVAPPITLPDSIVKTEVTTQEVLMSWWSSRAGSLHERNLTSPRDLAADTYDQTDERVAFIHARQDLAMIYSQIDSLNEQVWVCKWLLAIIALGIAIIAYHVAR